MYLFKKREEIVKGGSYCLMAMIDGTARRDKHHVRSTSEETDQERRTFQGVAIEKLLVQLTKVAMA